MFPSAQRIFESKRNKRVSTEVGCIICIISLFSNAVVQILLAKYKKQEYVDVSLCVVTLFNVQ